MSKYIKIGNCKISKNVTINKFSIIGKLYRPFLDKSVEKPLKTTINKNVYIGFNCIIGNGTIIKKNTIIDDFSIIESRVLIGENNLIIYKSHICNDTKIGNNSVIGGLIAERTIIHDNCRIFGKIVHKQYEPTKNWDDDDCMEKSPVIHDNVFIGFNSTVIGDISIGPNSYVTCGSIISINVPSGFVAYDKNKLIHHSKMISPLKYSKIFSQK